MSYKIALIVGHSQQDGGAYNEKFGLNEFRWNTSLVNQLEQMLEGHPHLDPIRIHRDSYKGLPAKVNASGADIAIEFHA